MAGSSRRGFIPVTTPILRPAEAEGVHEKDPLAPGRGGKDPEIPWERPFDLEAARDLLRETGGGTGTGRGE